MFTGQYEVSLNALGRFTIPQRYLTELRAGQNVPRSFAFVARETLCIYTDRGFAEYVFSLYDKLTQGGPAGTVTRFLATQACHNTHAKHGSGGRAKLPKNLRELFSLPKNASLVLAGCGDHIELWERSRFFAAHGPLPGQE